MVLVPVPGPASDAPGMVSLKAGQTLEVPVWGEAGGEFVPAFTSEKQLLRAIPGGSRYVSLPMDDLVDLVANDTEIRLDVGDDQAAGARFAIGEPAQEPVALIREVGQFCAANAAVSTAWRALVKLEGEEPQPLIGLELLGEADPEAVTGLVTARIEAAGVGPAIVVPVDREHPDEFARYLLESTQPFWRA